MHFRDQMYLIEPMWAAPVEEGRQSSGSHSDAGPHAVYHYQHLRKKRSSCSHGNATTFYDHGARPSGLFQLGSLVKTQCSWVISKFKVQKVFCFCFSLSGPQCIKWPPYFFVLLRKAELRPKSPQEKPGRWSFSWWWTTPRFEPPCFSCLTHCRCRLLATMMPCFH